MLKKLVFLSMIVLFSYAQAQESDAQYKDWNVIVNQLRLKGIDASKVAWTEIETACTPLRSASEIEYNKCKFNKALDQNQYQSDINYCNSVAKQKHLEFIKPSISSYTFKDSSGKVIDGVRESQAKLNNQQENDFKNSAYITCMHDAGWNDPNSWARGRR